MFRQSLTEQKILCAVCGVLTTQTPSNLCVNCIRSQHDITENIPKSLVLCHCKGCGRYLVPPNVWVKAELESAELLSICLKKIRGINKVRLVDAKFVWTEPHSRRIQVRLKVENEYLSTIIQQTFITEFIVTRQYCGDCQKIDAKQVWTAVVQVRQKVQFKRTFYFLEQIILKCKAHKNTTNIKEYKDGVDFYYGQKSHAIQMVDFLQSIVPTKLTKSEHLVSRDVKTGKNTYKFTYSITIIPICRFDLICISPKLASSFAKISPMLLCVKVSNTLTFMDVSSLRCIEIRPQKYWESSQDFSIIRDHRSLETFYVIDINPENVVSDDKVTNQYIVEVCYPSNMEKRAIARTNIGHLIKPGDYVLGYNMVNANMNSEIWDELTLDDRFNSRVPEVVIVRKTYPRSLKKSKNRTWKLKKFNKQIVDDNNTNAGSTVNMNSNEREYESFLREIEETPDLREHVTFYPNNTFVQKNKKKTALANTTGAHSSKKGQNSDQPEVEEMHENSSECDDFPEIKIEDLYEDLDGLKINE